MSKKTDKKSLFTKLFGHSKQNKKTNDEESYNDHANRSQWAGDHHNQQRHRARFVDDTDDMNLRDENGLYRPTAAYHTSARTKASRGARSYAGKDTKTMPVNYSSDSDGTPHNRSFQSAYNADDIAKRNFRRSSKRSKKSTRPAFETFDEQSSSTASYNVLQNVDMNTKSRHDRNEYWQRPIRQQPDENWIKIELLERKYRESQEKISDYVNRYRKEKHRAGILQERLDDLEKKGREDFRMIHEQQKQIQELQKDIERLRGASFLQPPPLFNQSHSFQSHFQQRNSATPSSHIFPTYHNQGNIHLNEMSNTRTGSEIDNESGFALKNFQSGHKQYEDGAPAQMISESSIAMSTDREDKELARCSKDDSFSTLANTIIMPELVPIIRDEGYSTTDTVNKNFNRRNRHLATAVPPKIRRTNSWN